jgi:hypothetical protein
MLKRVLAGLILTVAVQALFVKSSAGSSALPLDDDIECKLHQEPYRMREVLDCFHPEGGNVIRADGRWDCESSDKDFEPLLSCQTCNQAIETGNATMDGVLHFAGAISKKHYRLNFTIQTRLQKKRLYSRILPVSDEAPFPPNQSCWMRDWMPWDI